MTVQFRADEALAEENFHRLHDHIANLEAELEDDARVINVWRNRTYRAELQVDVLKSCIKHIDGLAREGFDNPANAWGNYRTILWITHGALNQEADRE